MCPPESSTRYAAPTRLQDGRSAPMGTMATFITYAKALDDAEPDSSEYALLVDRIRALGPTLRAVGLFDVMSVRDGKVAAILDM